MNGSPEVPGPGPEAAPPLTEGVPRGSAAPLVAAGILSSRVAGLVRERIFAHYFGASVFADAFKAALRAPNILQNLLGEGALSASFIPVYSELLERGRREEAGRVAGAVFALLFALVGALVLIGILLAPVIVSVFSPGFEGTAREFTIRCFRIIFPMTGTLVLSAWALGVLNSHRRFFIPYFAPVLWNGAMIATLLVLGTRMELDRLVIALAWGALAGGLVQFLVQLPWVLTLERDLRIRPDVRLEGVRTALRNAGPAIAGRGAVQIGSYVDLFLASFLAAGAVASLTYAQTLYILPVSLFGMSIAAAELPEMARGRTGAADVLGARMRAGLRHMAVFVVPSMVAFIVLGDVLVGALYQTGEFSADDTLLVWAILAAYAIGLMASTATRLFSSAFFAMHDTRTPAKAALMRVVLSGGAGVALMLALRDVELAGRSMGPVGLALATGAAAWVEWLYLRRALRTRLGSVGTGARFLLRVFASALAAAAAGRSAMALLPDPLPIHADYAPVIVALVVLTVFGLVYFGVARLLGVEEVAATVGRITAKLRRR